MTDRLKEIEWRLKYIKQTDGAVADITWLVEEVKRLSELLNRTPNLVI